MSELPNSWAETTLATVSFITTGNTPPTKSKELYGGVVPFVKPGDLDKRLAIASTEQFLSEKGASLARLLRPGAVLVSCIGNLGKVGVAGSALATNQQINSAEFYPRLVDDRYGYYVCKTLKPWMESEASATTIAILNKGRFSEAPFPLAPLPEQKRIADKLDRVLARVDACSDRLNRLSGLLKRFRQSILATATSGRLTEDWRLGDEQKWTYERATDVCAKVQSGGTPKEGFVHQGIPFLKVYNIVDQKVAFDYRPQFIEPTIHGKSMSKSQVTPGDVLMNIVGPPLGKVAIVPDTYQSWNINQAITLFRPSERITTSWLYYLLCGGENIKEIVHETRGSAGQTNISLSQCREFIFPVPPLPEQAEIVRRVELLFAFADRLEARLATALKQVGQLTPSLLTKAFRGELVPQDPDDEPASALLERIRSERESSEGRPHSRRHSAS